MSFDLKSRLGALPSPWDIRHYRVPRATLLMALELPEEMPDLDPFMPPIQSQGDIGSCVGHDGDMIRSATHKLEKGTFADLSAGWLYYWSRHYANIPEWQEGSTNLGLMKALNKDGATTELCAPTDDVAPFDIDWCNEAFEIAKNYAIDEYWNVNPNPPDIKAAMMGWTHEANYKMPDDSPGKIPLVSAFPVYESFYDSLDNGGIVPMPKPSDKLLGGHSSAIGGWIIIDDVKYWVNYGSWGTDIADNGKFYIPEDYPFYGGDWWLIHNGPPSEFPDSSCPVGNGFAKLFNGVPWILGRRGRFKYFNER